MQKFKIEGNHPILKRIDWNAVGLDELNQKINELSMAGYEIKIIPDGFIGDERRDTPF